MQPTHLCYKRKHELCFQHLLFMTYSAKSGQTQLIQNISMLLESDQRSNLNTKKHMH